MLPVTWASDNFSVMSVNATGVVTGHRPGSATITATTSDGAGTVVLTVADAIAGLPARVRFANAADDRASVTFNPSQGPPVTLGFGESVELPVVSGLFSANVFGQGFLSTQDRQWLIGGGEYLEVYATRWGITGDFNQASVPGSGVVRFVQGSAGGYAAVVLLGPPGVAAASAILINCYFDPLDMTQHATVPAAEFDVIVGSKGLLFTRSGGVTIRATPPPGRAVTYVLVGDSPDTVRLLPFP
jgi:hypothetical protein